MGTHRPDGVIDLGSNTINYDNIYNRPDTAANVESVPVGGIVMWSDVSSIPQGFYVCDGGSKVWQGVNPPPGSKNEDGTDRTEPYTTFTNRNLVDTPIPDLRSRFIIGYDPNDPSYNAINKTGGSISLSPDNIPAHSHYSAQNHTVGDNDYYLGQYNSVTTHATGGDYIGVGTSIDDAYTTSVTGEGKPYSPPYITMLFIIRVKVPLTSDTQLWGKNVYYVPNRLAVGLQDPLGCMHIAKDVDPDNVNTTTNWHTDASNSQLLLTGGPGNINKRLALGVDTTGDYTFLQGADHEGGIVTKYLSLQPKGGNVGIGITNPGCALDINTTDAIRIPVGTNTDRDSFTHQTGQIRFNTSTSQFEGYNNSDAWQGLGGVIDVDQDTYILAESAPTADEDTLTFFTGGSQHMIIDESGNVGIGTTSPTEKLDVNGRVQATSFNATSDARLKDNITPLNNPLMKIIQLQGVNFTWKKEDSTSLNAGLIAQDIEKVIPEVVSTQNNEIQQKSVDYNGLIPYLIESVKTLSTEKDNMQKEIDSLKAENKAMKEKMKQYDEWFAQLMNK